MEHQILVMLGNCSRFLNFTTPSWTPLASSLEIAVQEFGWLGDNVSPAMTIALPPVPNVVGAFGWFTAVFSVKMWKLGGVEQERPFRCRDL